MPNETKTNIVIRETAKHHAAFWDWYALERNYTRTKSKLNVSNVTLNDWIKKFGWHARADEVDRKAQAKYEAKTINERAKRQAEMIENHYKYGTNLVSVGGNYLQKNGVDSGGQAIQAVKIGVEIQRTAEGLATGKQEIEHGGTIRTETEVITPKVNDSNT